MELLERRAQLPQICLAIARHLPEGWRVDTDLSEGERENNDHVWFRYLATKMRFSISFDGRDGKRLDVRSWNWPSYSRLERGEARTEMITPRDLYDPKESSPSISVSAERDPKVIAADIGRRFIPDYIRIYARCQEKADARQAHEDKARAQWQEICDLIGKDPKWNHYYQAIGPLEITNSNGSLKVEGYVPLEDVKALIALFKGWKKEE